MTPCSKENHFTTYILSLLDTKCSVEASEKKGKMEIIFTDKITTYHSFEMEVMLTAEVFDASTQHHTAGLDMSSEPCSNF